MRDAEKDKSLKNIASMSQQLFEVLLHPQGSPKVVSKRLERCDLRTSCDNPSTLHSYLASKSMGDADQILRLAKVLAEGSAKGLPAPELEEITLLALKENFVGAMQALLQTVSREQKAQLFKEMNPIMVAATAGRPHMLEVVLAHSGVDINATSNDGLSPGGRDGSSALMLAAKLGHSECVRLLLAQPGINVNHRGGLTPATAAELAAVNNHVNCLGQILNHPESKIQESRGSSPLLKACIMLDDTRCLRMMLKHPCVDINHLTREGSALMYAAQRSRLAAFDLMLAEGELDINSQDFIDGDTALIRALDREKDYAIHDASGPSSKVAFVERLLAEPEIAVNIQNKKGNTAVMLAAQYADIDSLKLLLERPDIDINLQSKKGETALMLAAAAGAKDCVDLLLANGAKVNLTDKKGRNALHFATTPQKPRDEGSHLGCMLSLIVNGVDVEAETKAGYTPLILTALRGDIDASRLLLDGKATPNHYSFSLCGTAESLARKSFTSSNDVADYIKRRTPTLRESLATSLHSLFRHSPARKSKAPAVTPASRLYRMK